MSDRGVDGGLRNAAAPVVFSYDVDDHVDGLLRDRSCVTVARVVAGALLGTSTGYGSLLIGFGLPECRGCTPGSFSSVEVSSQLERTLRISLRCLRLRYCRVGDEGEEEDEEGEGEEQWGNPTPGQKEDFA